MSYRAARWVTGPRPAIEALTGGHGRALVTDSRARPVILFDSEWTLKSTVEREEEVEFHDVAP
jgi:peptide chain release factor 3